MCVLKKRTDLFFAKSVKTHLRFKQDGLPRWAHGETWSTPSQQWLQRPQQQQPPLQRQQQNGAANGCGGAKHMLLFPISQSTRQLFWVRRNLFKKQNFFCSN